MKNSKLSKKPKNPALLKNNNLVICYLNEKLNNDNIKILLEAKKEMTLINEIIISPRDAKCFKIKKGNFFRIENLEGPQVVI